MKLANEVRGSLVVVHVLYDEVGCAEVDEAPARVYILEQRSQQLHQLFLAIVVENQVLLRLD